MASNNGYLTHCRICGTPIFSLGNRQFCSACYAQNRRNAAHRSNAEAKMRREQAKREEEKMKALTRRKSNTLSVLLAVQLLALSLHCIHEELCSLLLDFSWPGILSWNIWELYRGRKTGNMSR